MGTLRPAAGFQILILPVMRMKDKKQKNQTQTVYFSDELHDEFSRAKITPRLIDGKYRYKRDCGVIGKFMCFFLHRVIAQPIALAYLKIKFRHKIIGKEALADCGGCFVYGNHTQAVADALIPTFVAKPRHAHVIVHASNVSIPVLGRLTPYMGAIPLPDTRAAAKNFNLTVSDRIKENCAIFIYPEAHIWPYFTGIRNFPSDSFSYPMKTGAPVFCFTNVYKKRGRRPNSVRILTYVDGPFFPDGDLPVAEGREQLRRRVFDCMTERARMSDASVIEYRPRVEDVEE